MASRIFVIFAAFISLFASSNVATDIHTLENVFGYTLTVTPAPGGTPEELDNWDWDNFNPSPADYDSFDWALTNRVAASSNQNFLLSPLGLKLTLAILTEAATGATQDELVSILGYGRNRTLGRSKFATTIESLQTESAQYNLNLGSRIYIGDTAQPRPRFAAIAQEFYKTELKTVNFQNPAVASKEINYWCSNITQGRIPNLVNEDDVTNMVVLILSTLIFKGSWRHQFPPQATTIGVFYVSHKILKTVPFMNVNDKFYYADSVKYDAKILKMPYLGNKHAMYIIVPNSLTGLPRLLNDLSDLRQEVDKLRGHQVEVTLPKFNFDYTSQLDGVLRELGVRAAFEETASFPGIARNQLERQRLKISRVLQQSGIKINELGSVAYSSTEIAPENKFGVNKKANAKVVANRPFLFFIQDEATRQLLFTGRVADPSQVDGTFKVFFSN